MCAVSARMPGARVHTNAHAESHFTANGVSLVECGAGRFKLCSCCKVVAYRLSGLWARHTKGVRGGPEGPNTEGERHSATPLRWVSVILGGRTRTTGFTNQMDILGLKLPQMPVKLPVRMNSGAGPSSSLSCGNQSGSSIRHLA